MRFIDETVVQVKAGNGGQGAVTFRRAAYVPKGGPDGGDGGKGGSIIFQASPQTGTLDKIQRHTIKAKNGMPGQKKKRAGRSGKNVVIKVPLGTTIYNAETNEILADLIDVGQKVIVAQGGKGGRGNTHFASAVNRTPRRYDVGEKGQTFRLRLVMKLLADVGLVGLPNAGKSTLLGALSRANPKIGEFPFTTLTPGLGVVSYGVYQRFTVADLPGLIKGAAEGKGLGHQFLRHIERTRLLVFLIDTTETNYAKAYQSLWSELDTFDSKLSKLPRLIIRSKSDLSAPINKNTEVDSNPPLDFDISVSSVTGEGLSELIEMIAGRLGLIAGI